MGLEAFLISIGLTSLAEIGDQPRIATAGPAIRFETLPLVVAGSALGMMLAP